MLRGGKRQFGGKIAYAGAIRNSNPLLCCHGAIGRDLCQRFTVDSSPFPDPAVEGVWLHTPLWPGSNPAVSISYNQHAEMLKRYLGEAAVIIAKVTHLFRMYMARDLDEQGVDDRVSGVEFLGVGGWGSGPPDAVLQTACGLSLPSQVLKPPPKQRLHPQPLHQKTNNQQPINPQNR